MSVCAFPGCYRDIASDSRTGVCRNHMHKPGCCHCSSCTGKKLGNERDVRFKSHIKTREELVDEGLLPPDPVIRGDVRKVKSRCFDKVHPQKWHINRISLPREPWRDDE